VTDPGSTCDVDDELAVGITGFGDLQSFGCLRQWEDPVDLYT